MIFIPDKQIDSIDHTLINCSNWNGFSDSSFFLNNIFYVKCSMGFQFGQNTHNHFAHNLYSGKFTNLPDDAAALFSDPRFVSLPVSGWDGFCGLKCFKLQQNSPCINQGEKISSNPLKDFFGNWVDVDKNPSIGINQLEP